MSATPHVLLVETREGDAVAVRFPSAERARAWEDAHHGRVTVLGCLPLVTTRDALGLS